MSEWVCNIVILIRTQGCVVVNKSQFLSSSVLIMPTLLLATKIQISYEVQIQMKIEAASSVEGPRTNLIFAFTYLKLEPLSTM